jgi:acetyl-CoA carboxylase biotin carboxyl carrier protein
MKKTYEWNGPEEKDVVQNSHTFATPGSATAAALKSVCSSVAELARSAPKPPSRIKLCHGSTTVEMEWPDPAAVPPTTPQAAPPEAASDPGSASAAADDGRRYIRSPMVGTFYRADDPGAAPMVSVGDRIQVGQSVGVLEVMKMMSYLEADVAGRVVDILVANAQSVQFQQPLIAVSTREDG